MERENRARDGTSDSPQISKKPVTFLGRPLNKFDIDEVKELPVAGKTTEDKRLALALAIPTTKRSLRPWDQVATDERGRRRFHGAFTGGFSAGYFNTVDTPEGWKPQTFRSSRHSRQTATGQQVEDFMDEEDLENVASSGRSSLIKVVAPDGTSGGVMALSPGDTQLLTPIDVLVGAEYNDSVPIGERILKRMGWRPGTNIFGAKLRRAPKALLERQARILGPHRPSFLEDANAREYGKDKPEEGGYDDEAWLERRRQITEDLQKTCKTFVSLKTDFRGLGALGALNLRPEGRVKAMKLRGEGFGIGILEENDDIDIYTGTKEDSELSILDEDSSSVVIEEKRPLEFVASTIKEERECIDDRLKHWSMRRFLIQSVPNWFTGRHSPSVEELEEDKVLKASSSPAPSNVEGIVQQLIKFLKEKSLWEDKLGSMKGNVSEATDRRRALLGIQAAGDATVPRPTDRQKPLWGAVTNEARKALISTTKFTSAGATIMDQKEKSQTHLNVKYFEDMDKQKRYELFCLALNVIKHSDVARPDISLYQEEKVSPSVAFKAQSSMSKEDASAERLDFGKKYREFRIAYPSAPLALDTGVSVAERQKAAVYTRTSYNWKPDNLLCKRLGVKNPWEGKAFVDDRPDDEVVKSSHFRSRRPLDRSADFVSSIATLLRSSKSTETSSAPSNESACSLPKEDESSTPQSQIEDDLPPVQLEKPPLSIFQSVFGEGDEDDS